MPTVVKRRDNCRQLVCSFAKISADGDGREVEGRLRKKGRQQRDEQEVAVKRERLLCLRETLSIVLLKCKNNI